MSFCAPSKQSPVFRRCIKFCTILLGIVATLFLVLSASILSPAFSSHFPFHAQCKLEWTWKSTNCSFIHGSLLKQAKQWNGPDNCKSGGEKCLYSVLSDGDNQIILEHSTPVHKYKDKIVFDFCDSCRRSELEELEKNAKIHRLRREVSNMEKTGSCVVTGFSRSEVWYAVYDYGTNYCNMRNLADGAGITKFDDFTQQTSEDICTQLSSADCKVY